MYAIKFDTVDYSKNRNDVEDLCRDLGYFLVSRHPWEGFVRAYVMEDV